MTVINNNARDQYSATNGQTIFNYTFEISDQDNIQVYQRAEDAAPDDTADLLALGVDYTVTGVGVNTGGTIVLTVGATLNDIVTLQGNAPPVRSTTFTPGGVIQAANLNTEFDDEILIYQTLLARMNFLIPAYPKSAVVNDFDLVLPILGAEQTWVMNAAGTQIVAADFPADGAANKLDTYVTMTDCTANEPNSYPLSAIGSAFMVNVVGTNDIVTRTLTGTANQLAISNPTGQAGNPVFSIVDNPIMPGTAGMGIPQGTTAQRAVPSSGIGLRYNTTLAALEYYAGGTWIQLDDADLSLYLLLAGGTMTGDIDMGVTNKVVNAADPTDPQDYATKAYVDGGGGGGPPFLPLAGGTMAGDIDFDSLYTGINVKDPVNPQDIATKNYVDQTALTGTSVYAATTATLNATQAGSGVGATLTDASGTFAAFTTDGQSPSVGDNILNKDQAAAANQGIYTLTQNGNGVNLPWILTRATTYNTPAEINQTGLITIRNGTTLGGTQWYNTSTIVTVDTTAFSYSEFGAAFVESVTGTANEIDVDNTDPKNPVLSLSSTLVAPGTITVGDLFFTGDSIQHLADLNNQILFGTDTQSFETGGVSRMDLSDTGMRLGAANSCVTTILDEDNMVSDSATALATQQSIKYYADHLAQLLDANGNETIKFTGVASAVNEITVSNAATGNKPSLSATGGDTDIILQLNGKGTGGVEIEGTSTNDNATTGYVGELISSVFSATAISTGSNANVGTLNLTAGDWDLFGNCTYVGSGAGVWTSNFLGFSTVSVTYGTPGTYLGDNSAGFGTNSTQGYVMPPTRVSLSGNTTYYLVAQCNYTTGSIAAYGGFYARRKR